MLIVFHFFLFQISLNSVTANHTLLHRLITTSSTLLLHEIVIGSELGTSDRSKFSIRLHSDIIMTGCTLGVHRTSVHTTDRWRHYPIDKDAKLGCVNSFEIPLRKHPLLRTYDWNSATLIVTHDRQIMKGYKSFLVPNWTIVIFFKTAIS